MRSELWSSTDTQRRRLTRRQLVAAGILPDQRRAPRFMTIAPATLQAWGETERRTGLVRDVSATGIFVYSNFKPRAGDGLEVVVRLANHGSDVISLAGKGVVVRVEDAGAGAAFGIALEIAAYELRINSKPVACPNAFEEASEQLCCRASRIPT